jgi:protoporphyrinogen oxidase
MRARAPVAVLGAGIAGLVAAHRLQRHGVRVMVYEGQDKVAGMATSHVGADGFSYDIGGHFITNRLAAALGAGAQCRLVARYDEAVISNGGSRSYPGGLLREPRYVLSAVRGRLKRRPIANAADWFRGTYGDALADDIALPLLEAWSGVAADELAPAVGAKIPVSLIETMFLRGAARATRRAVAIGYCGAKPQAAAVYHVYPMNGVGGLCEGLATGLGESLMLNSPVEKIYVSEGRAVGLRIAGRDIDASAVISTAPINVLPKIVEGTDALEPYRSFRFRPLVMVNLKMTGRGLLPATLTWVPHERPFFRLTEATLSMPWLAPEGKTMVMAEYGAQIDDAHWTMSDEDLISLTVDHLHDSGIVTGARDRLIGGNVMRAKLAYPVFLNRYEPNRVRLAHGTGVRDLLSIGRNGEFDHILMEDIYWRTLDRVDSWVAGSEQLPLASR